MRLTSPTGSQANEQDGATFCEAAVLSFARLPVRSSHSYSNPALAKEYSHATPYALSAPSRPHCNAACSLRSHACGHMGSPLRPFHGKPRQWLWIAGLRFRRRLFRGWAVLADKENAGVDPDEPGKLPSAFNHLGVSQQRQRRLRLGDECAANRLDQYARGLLRPLLVGLEFHGHHQHRRKLR